MSPLQVKLQGAYSQALRGYLQTRDEGALRQAYELGRQALAEGLGPLELADAHHEALREIFSILEGWDPGAWALSSAGDFFREALSPFHALHRGYQDTLSVLRERAEELRAANGRLREMNESLEHQVRERTRAVEEKARELARSNSELQQFVYAVSHDLKEPLRMISCFVQLLKTHLIERMDKRIEEYLRITLDAAHRLQQLIDDLLSYTRLGAQSLVLRPVPLIRVFHETMDNLKLLVEEKGAEVTHGFLPSVEADSAQMGLLFQNLLENAVRFHGAKRPRVHLFAWAEEDEWVIRVRDNGIGIEPQYFEKIFEVFQRLHNRDKYPGTGIGLALCKRIVEQHKGRIWVESEPGKGSVFCFTIPRKNKGGEHGLSNGSEAQGGGDPSGGG